MASSYSIPGQDIKYRLPDDGEVFRVTGGGKTSVYKRVGNQLSSLSGVSDYARTDLRMKDGSIVRAGQPITNSGALVGPADPNFRGEWSTMVSQGDKFDQMYGG